MSFDFTTWLGEATSALIGTPTDHEPERAAAAYRHILDKPTSVTFLKPNGTTLAAQTVRLESDNSATDSESEAGQAPVRKLIIFGVLNHATVTDTDIAEGYRFIHDNDEYRVTDVIPTIGEVQGVAEATG